eukprot:gene15154-biopygen9700
MPRKPRGNRTLARAWRGHGAGVARAVAYIWLGWRGRGAGMARAWRGQPPLGALPGPTPEHGVSPPRGCIFSQSQGRVPGPRPEGGVSVGRSDRDLSGSDTSGPHMESVRASNQ